MKNVTDGSANEALVPRITLSFAHMAILSLLKWKSSLPIVSNHSDQHDRAGSAKPHSAFSMADEELAAVDLFQGIMSLTEDEQSREGDNMDTISGKLTKIVNAYGSYVLRSNDFTRDYSIHARALLADLNARQTSIRNQTVKALSRIDELEAKELANCDADTSQKFAVLETSDVARSANPYKDLETNLSEISARKVELSDILDTPRFKNNYWKLGIPTFILLWVMTSSFLLGVAFGVGAIAAFALFLQTKHNNGADEVIRELSSVHSKKCSILARVKEQKAKIKEVFAAERREANEKGRAEFEDFGEEIEREKQLLRSGWQKRCAQSVSEVQAIVAEMDELIGAAHGYIDNFSPDDPVSMPDLVLEEQVHIRLGETLPPSPAPLDAELRSAMGIDEGLSSLARNIPVFWKLGDWRPLIVHGDLGPASSYRPRVLEAVLTRVLRQFPPGKVVFTLFDPLGLGKNFAPFLTLKDHSDTLISGTVWSRPDHIRRQLEDLIEHIENVTQKYLRSDYPTIEAFNKDAGDIAEPYRFLVICDFPEGFNEETTRDLIRVIQNGPRCGIHTIIYWNKTIKEIYGFNEGDFVNYGLHLQLHSAEGDRSATPYVWWFDQEVKKRISKPCVVDAPPATDHVRETVNRFGSEAIEAMKVEIPFGDLFGLAGLDGGWWSQDSTDSLNVPLGPIGAKKVCAMTLDSRMSNNALIVGRPGSGKSNLMHVFISMVAHQYSPDEVELYLVDFKQGVEFKPYANAKIPHAKVIAVQSEREFGLSVLAALDKEMTRRSNLFKEAEGSENIGEYRRQRPEARMPRAVLLVDEFQEFFSRDDKIKDEATILLDRIVRQGRSYGVHVILATQSLNNSGLPRSTIDQIPIRIAMQCSEADSRVILADDNIAARSLVRPGQAIYNEKAGLVEGNNEFQVALFPNKDRKLQLTELEGVIKIKGWKGEPPRIFEGHEPASLEGCQQIRKFSATKATGRLPVWIGEPVSLDPPIAVEFAPQSGRNLLVITREERLATDLILSALASLVSQLTPRDLEVDIIDLTTADAEWADYPESLAGGMRHHRINVGGKHDLKTLLPEMATLVEDRRNELERSDETRNLEGARKVLAIIGAHRARNLRKTERSGSFLGFDEDEQQEQDVDLAKLLKKIVADGPEVGVHVMMWVDSLTSFERILDRNDLDEFALRASGSLSDMDSRTLFDDSVASRIDKPNRMVVYDDDQVGVFRLFRPYVVPSEEFFYELAEQMFSDVMQENR